MFWLTLMVIFISCDLSTVTGDSYMMAQQALSCVMNARERRVKRETGVGGIGIGMWAATIGVCLGSGGFGCVALAGASIVYTATYANHALLLYKGQVFEWGYDGFHHSDMPKTTTCNITIINHTFPTNVSISEVINFGKHYEMEKGGYRFVQHNCHDFRNNLMSFLDLDWGEEDNPRTAVYTGTHSCRTVTGPRVPFILINGTIISIGDTLRVFDASSSWKQECRPRWDSSLPAVVTDKYIDDITGYRRNYSNAYNTQLISEDLFMERLLMYLEPKDNIEALYEVGVQYGGCTKGGLLNSTEPPYNAILRYRGLLFEWGEEGFYLSIRSRHPECRIEWNLDRIPSATSWITTDTSISNCSLQDINSFGQLNGFFNGEYGRNNRGYQFVNNLVNILSSNCQDLSFGCETPFTTSCSTESIVAFERMYKTFRGSRGWILNTCSTYRGYFDRYISGYCNLVELDRVHL